MTADVCSVEDLAEKLVQKYPDYEKMIREVFDLYTK